MNILFSVLFLLFPSAMIFLCGRYSVFKKIGTVLLCYLAGMLIGNIGILPKGFGSVQNTLSEISVALALPMLLFSMDVKAWFKTAGKAMLSMLFAVVSVVIVTFIMYLLFRGVYPDAWKLSGMAAGVYTGGTPNLAAIKSALDVSGSDYIVFHTYDTVLSLAYIFLLVSAARGIFLRYLKPYKIPVAAGQPGIETDAEAESIEEYSGILRPVYLKGIIICLALSCVIVGLSVWAGGFFKPSASSAVTILLITTLGISASFIRRIRSIKRTFPAGMYIIYVFCFTVASMTDIKGLAKINWVILAFVFAGIFGSLMLHSLFCKFAGIDADTFMVTSVSAICSPPFVPVVAGALKNPAVLLSGLTTGIIGYAVGNYLGITLSFLYKSLP